MIIPLINEEEWKRRLKDLPTWQPPLLPTLVVSPHPDDETLGAGGLIMYLRSRGTKVSVLAVTSGENAYKGLEGLGPIREIEQQNALSRLGVDAEYIHRLRLTDSGLGNHIEELRKALQALVTAETHVIAPWVGDFHPDHEICGSVATEVANEVGASLTSYFFWTWHRGKYQVLDALKLVALPLTELEMQKRREALFCHQSQLEHESFEPILPQYLLGPIDRPYEVFLPDESR